MKWLVLMVFLSGCAQTLANLNGRMTDEQKSRVVMRWVQQCEALGYKRDTDPWRDCILKQRDYDLRRSQALADQFRGPVSCYRDVLGTTCY